MDEKWIDVTARTLEGTERGNVIFKNLQKMVEEQALDRIAKWKAFRGRTMNNNPTNEKSEALLELVRELDIVEHSVSDTFKGRTFSRLVLPEGFLVPNYCNAFVQQLKFKDTLDHIIESVCAICDDRTSAVLHRICESCQNEVHRFCQNELFYQKNIAEIGQHTAFCSVQCFRTTNMPSSNCLPRSNMGNCLSIQSEEHIVCSRSMTSVDNQESRKGATTYSHFCINTFPLHNRTNGVSRWSTR